MQRSSSLKRRCEYDFPPTSARKSRTGKVELSYMTEPYPCVVCGQLATGFHYGVMVCEGCKGFFRRTVQTRRDETYRCIKGDSSCVVFKASKNDKLCQYCRYQQCIKTGMRTDKVLDPVRRSAKNRLIAANRMRRQLLARATNHNQDEVPLVPTDLTTITHLSSSKDKISGGNVMYLSGKENACREAITDDEIGDNRGSNENTMTDNSSSSSSSSSSSNCSSVLNGRGVSATTNVLPSSMESVQPFAETAVKNDHILLKIAVAFQNTLLKPLSRATDDANNEHRDQTTHHEMDDNVGTAEGDCVVSEQESRRLLITKVILPMILNAFQFSAWMTFDIYPLNPADVAVVVSESLWEIVFLTLATKSELKNTSLIFDNMKFETSAVQSIAEYGSKLRRWNLDAIEVALVAALMVFNYGKLQYLGLTNLDQVLDVRNSLHNRLHECFRNRRPKLGCKEIFRFFRDIFQLTDLAQSFSQVVYCLLISNAVSSPPGVEPRPHPLFRVGV